MRMLKMTSNIENLYGDFHGSGVNSRSFHFNRVDFLLLLLNKQRLKEMITGGLPPPKPPAYDSHGKPLAIS